MSLDAGRVCEVFAPGPAPSPGEDQRGEFGSGYLLADGLVLTARHVIAKVAAPCRVRLGGTDSWVDAAVAWSGPPPIDAAVLRAPLALAGEAPRLGRLAGGERVACRALGFPRAQQRERIRDTEAIAGEIDPLTMRKAGLLAIHLEGSVPLPDADGRSPWAGFSGAALFAGPLLVGVVIVDPVRFGTDRLVAVPVTALVADDGFRVVTGAPDGDRLPAVEDEPARELLTTPYEPPPAPGSLAGAPPSRLLHPRNGVVPFHGRAKLLEELVGWCAGDGLAIALVHGPGGSGKTRLAAELAARQGADGRVGGFLERGADPAPLERATGGLVVIVDEAPLRVDEIAALLRRLVARGVPTRLVLVARDAGDWLRTLADRLADAAAVSRVLDGHWERELGPLDDTPVGRQAAFAEATAAFAAATGRPPGAPPPLDVEAAVFERPLFLHLAALTALEGRPTAEGAPIAADVLEATLELEAGYWRRTAAAGGLEGVDDAVLTRAVALATLVTAATEGEAARLLEAVPDLAGDGQLARKLARWLATLYPGSGQLRPLEPDLLGDANLGRVLEAVPELATQLLARTDPDQTKHALGVLTRAARSHPSAERALRAVLSVDLETRSAPAIEVATETGDPIGRILAEVLETVAPPGLARQLLERLPDFTVALREVAVVAASQALAAARTAPPGPDRDANVARLAGHLGGRLADLGRPEEALAAAEEAAAIYRALAATAPEAFRPDLALALTNLSNPLAAVGRRDEALAAADESVVAYRDLAIAQPDVFRLELASALNILAIRLAENDRAYEALLAIEEAVAIDRELVAVRPDAALPELARALNNVASLLAGVGRQDEALTAGEEAAAIYRELAAAQPDAFGPDLAIALYTLALGLADVGRPDDALAAAEQAVAMYRELAAARPDAFGPDLAMALSGLGNRLAEVGRPEEVRAAGEEAVAMYRELAAARPDAFRPDLANALTNRGYQLAAVGRPEEALSAGEEAVAMYREFASAARHTHRPSLALALYNLGIQLAAVGRSEEALAAGEEAVDMLREFAATGSDAFGSALAMALTSLHNQLAEVGRPDEAQAAAEEAAAINRELDAARRSGSNALTHDLR